MRDDVSGMDAVVTTTGGASTTVGDAAAFWFDLEAGQTERYDPLRLHLLSAHAQLNATVLTDDEAATAHHDEHYGPGGIHNHDPASTDWDLGKAASTLTDVEAGFLTFEQSDRYTATFNAHVYRGSAPGQARTKPWRHAPTVFEAATRFTVSILPPDHPRRRYFELQVAKQGRTGDQWTVTSMAEILDAAGNWRAGLSPERNEVFTFDAAMAAARKAAETVSPSGLQTALDVLNEEVR